MDRRTSEDFTRPLPQDQPRKLAEGPPRPELDDAANLFARACRIDRTLGFDAALLARLRRRRLLPVRYARDVLFCAMAAGQPVVFEDFRVAVKNEARLGTREAVLDALYRHVPASERARVHYGKTQSLKMLGVKKLLARWETHSGLVNVTDLHVRDTKVAKCIDIDALSDFNLLAGAPGAAAAEEMMTMVVGSAGVYTDSHSDDPDGSNHCFVGKKLWLVWDTFKGAARGLDDVERFECRRKYARFSIDAFLSVPGARWFTVETGQTLFLPGHLTHKVVTLEDYLGIGSFFTMLPSYWRTLQRWTKHTPLWAVREPTRKRLMLVDEISDLAIARVRALANAPQTEKEYFGLPQLEAAVAAWRRTTSPAERRMMAANRGAAKLYALLTGADIAAD